MKLTDLVERFKDVETAVDEEKLGIVTQYLTNCVFNGVLKSSSPLFTILLYQAIQYAKVKEVK